MMIVNYPSKKALAACIGQPLDYTETSIMGPEFVSNGTIVACNRPQINPRAREQKPAWREFFAEIVMRDGLIFKVK